MVSFEGTNRLVSAFVAQIFNMKHGLDLIQRRYEILALAEEHEGDSPSID
jgi:hypothetical protein